ncbi:MAG: hypothetical protein E5Y16_34515 [Mesorhizobium sp.]|nr:MAG: hypothetical protein EOS08_29420 [Mesorhizobium sp.]TJV12963.1 MAG: hypothetical protein E5Y16_34515 [Mesorhizobium sp.]
MDQIVRLNSRQEAVLDDAADRFIARHKGDVRKALKAMMVTNADLNDQLERIITARPGARRRVPDPTRIERQLSMI